MVAPPTEGAANAEDGGDRSHVQKIDAGHFTCRKRHIGSDLKGSKASPKQPDSVSAMFYQGDRTGMVITPSVGKGIIHI